MQADWHCRRRTIATRYSHVKNCDTRPAIYRLAGEPQSPGQLHEGCDKRYDESGDDTQGCDVPY